MDVRALFTSIRSIRSIITFVITFAVVVLAYLTPQDDPKILLTIAFLVFIFAIYRFDPRIPIIYAILLLVVAAVFTSQKMDVVVQKLAELSYWTLIIGVTCILIELCRKKIVKAEV
jgi:membrane-bound metal-dependent hydrolase YbcI (DUF457 family)